MLPNDEERFLEAVRRLPGEDDRAMTKQEGHYVFELRRTVDAIAILKHLEDLVSSFEVLHGTMDDVFINVTGKDMRN